ncbi:MAG TPA: hypothetical protein VMZ28_23445 [Kofleriaceae bacterium]|nr:hypothetical protein [Kofleriaceae bacterium]
MGVRSFLAGALAALIVACGSGGGGSDPDADGGPDDADAGADSTALDCARKSGSRIRQVERVHSDDSDELLRLYDTELSVPCSFGAADDGSLRCLPQADGAPFAAGQIFYEDVDCTSSIARLDDALGPDAPDYMRQAYVSDDGCEVRTRFAELGNQLLVPADATVYDGGCNAVTAGTNPYFQITADLAPADLVEGTASWTDSGRVKQQKIDGADGSRVCSLAMVDQDLDSAPCTLAAAEDGATRCLPTPASLDDAFGNDVCDEPVSFALLDATCGEPSRYTTESTGGDCPKIRVRALLEEVDAVYQLGDTCEPIALDDNQTLFLEGPAVSGTSFSAFTPVYSTPGDRLERVDLDNGEGLRLATDLWRDPTFDSAWCSFQVAEDGLDRCLPVDSDVSPVAQVSSSVFYSDGACGTQVKVGVPDLTCGREMPKYAVEIVDGETLVYESLATWEADTLFENPGTCQAVADPTIYTHLSAELAAAMFVSGTEMIE